MKIYIFDDAHVIADSLEDAIYYLKEHFEIDSIPEIESKGPKGGVGIYLVSFYGYPQHTYYVLEKSIKKGVV